MVRFTTQDLNPIHFAAGDASTAARAIQRYTKRETFDRKEIEAKIAEVRAYINKVEAALRGL